jgi:hypothetical protein
VEPTPVPAELVEVKVETKEEEKIETVTEPVEEPKEMVEKLQSYCFYKILN